MFLINNFFKYFFPRFIKRLEFKTNIINFNPVYLLELILESY